MIDAFAQALHLAFLWAVPIAVVGFIVTLFLREIPLRDTVHVGLDSLEGGYVEPLPAEPIPSVAISATPGDVLPATSGISTATRVEIPGSSGSTYSSESP